MPWNIKKLLNRDANSTDKQHETNVTKTDREEENLKAKNSDITGSRDLLIQGQHNLSKTEDFTLEEDFLETASLDCSSLSGYVENALLASANNTLDRGAKKPTLSLDSDKEIEEVDSGSSSEGRKSSFSVQYVTYDFIASKSVSGLSSDGSSECFNSNESLNDQRKSEREEFVNSLLSKKNINANNNNSTLERYSKTSAAVDFAHTLDSSNLTEPEATNLKFNYKQASEISLNPDDSIVKNSVDNVDGVVHLPHCPLSSNENLVDNDEDMKAKRFLGLCLCQNAEVTDDESATELDFRNCNLKQIPIEIFQFTNTLQHLQLDSNGLSELPKALFSCTQLEYLTVSDNELEILPSGLAALTSLTYLDISKNVIEDVPDCIRCCKCLETLDASVNPIERLSEGFTQLVGLKELYLNDCFLEFLPASFGRLIHLSVLELRDNQLQILPKSIKRLTLLKRLDLGGNVFQEWPDVISQLLKLNELWLDGNELNDVPPELGDLTNLVYLDISRNFVESIPSRLGSLTQLTDLLLCENHILALPDTIGFMKKLNMLKCSMNQLREIPTSIGKLQEVEELDLSHNKLESIPASIGNLKTMHTCLLDNNMLDSIPSEIGNCSSLKILQLSRNNLATIPSKIGDLSELRVLNVCRNKLPHLPISVIKLAKLEALWVSSNQSKPNVPLHAESAPYTKARILTNKLFPQTEEKSSIKTDDEGYAIDIADDNTNDLKKVRGVTRVAFKFDVVNNENDDEPMDHDIHVDVSSNHIDDATVVKPSSLTVKIMSDIEVKDDLIETPITPTKHHFHKHEEPKDDLELLHMKGGKKFHHNEDKLINNLLEAEENIRKPKETPKPPPSLPVLPPNAGVKLSVGDSPDGEAPQVPKIKTWSSRNNLPSAITDVNLIGDKAGIENGVRDPADDIHFMDSDDNGDYDIRSYKQSLSNTNKKVLQSSDVVVDSKSWVSPSRNVPITEHDKPPANNNHQENDGPCPDWDSGVGNDVDSQESIPECPDEAESLPSSPASSSITNKTSSSTLSKTSSHTVPEKPKVSPKKLPIPSQSSIKPLDKNSTGSVFENIKKFETFNNKENQPKSTNINNTATGLNQNRKISEDKAIIRPNNHLSQQPAKTSAFTSPKVNQPVKHLDEKKSNALIQETNSNEVLFSSEDTGDLFTFSRVEANDKEVKKQQDLKRKLPEPAQESSKQQHFRDRLEKIMQQQRSVAMQASQAAQNISQSEMIMTYSRKSSLSALSGNETEDSKGLEKITAETTFPDDNQVPASPTKKGPPVYERMKNRLSERKPSQAPSSKIINRSRPGSAPATQLQRRGSSQRSSISALEGDDKKTLSSLGTNDNKNNLNQRARSKSIEQQLGQLLLTDSDDAQEELASHHRARNDRHDLRQDDRLRQNMLSNSSKFGVSGSRSSLVSPPPVRHNMYAKHRSSTNPPPVSDWKYKLLQHIERKRQEKTEVEANERYTNRQSIGKIKSPPKTNVNNQAVNYDHDNRYYVNNYDNKQSVYADPYKRGMSKSVTAPTIGQQPKSPRTALPRSHSNSSASKPSHMKPPKQRTFTPGPEHSNAFNEAVIQPQASRPKSAMEKYSPGIGYVEAHFHNPNNDLPSYKDHLERHKDMANHLQQIIPRHLESDTRQPQQKFSSGSAGFPLRPTGSHDSLMDNYTRYEKPAQPASYHHDNPIRTTNSHDSILDQVGQSNYYDPYQEQHHLLPTKLQYRVQPTVPQQYHASSQYHQQPLHYAAANQIPTQHKQSRSKHQEYTSPDHATYVNVMSYQQQQSPTGIPHQHGHGIPHGHGKTPPSYNQHKQHHNQYYNKPLPAEPPSYSPNYRNHAPPPPPQRHRHNHPYSGKDMQPQTHIIYKEEESVASAFRPYNQQKSLIPRQPPSYQPPPPIDQSRHRQHHRVPSGGQHQYPNYAEPQNIRRQSPPLRQQHSWDNEYEMITVSIRRNPTFGFHVMGGVGAGGNPYYANDDGVFITHVTPGGPAEGKLQPGDKIILVNGSKFVGISHTRAVDMLRNAGHSAVLVVERSLGKAV